MRYQIFRECWNEKTYNGYTDSPYWRIVIAGGYEIGLKDDGTFWNIKNNGYDINQAFITDTLITILIECKLNITLLT